MATKGEWRTRNTKHSWIIEYKDDKDGFYKGLCLGVDTEANAHLIVEAVNACIKLNPDNPLAVAESMGDLVEALKEMPEPKSILAEAAYTGGDVPKKWIAERSQFIDGYNQALKDVAKQREQFLAKVEGK